MNPNRFVDRCHQRLDSLEPIGDRSRSKAQSQQSQLLDRAMHRPLQVKLFQQQMRPDARAIKALGQELRRQRRRYRSWLFSTVASATITFSANDFSVDGRFDFDLLTVVTMAEVFKRLAAASTDQSIFG